MGVKSSGFFKYVKLALISLVVLVVIITIVGFVFPSNAVVSRTTDINAEIDSVKPYTLNINNWQSWMLADSTVGKQLSSANSDSVQLGTYMVKVIKRNDNYIVTEWHSDDMNETCTISLYGSQQNKITTVNWKFEQQLKWYPWERFKALLIDKILGDPMEAGLASLKKEIEQ